MDQCSGNAVAVLCLRYGLCSFDESLAAELLPQLASSPDCFLRQPLISDQDKQKKTCARKKLNKIVFGGVVGYIVHLYLIISMVTCKKKYFLK